MKKHRMDLPGKLVKIILVVFLLLAGSTLTHAQTTESSKDNSTTEQQPATDPLGRTTPHGSVSGYLDAIRSENFERAAQYFYVLDKSISQRFSAGFESARDLKILLDREGSFFEASALSNQPSGDLEDALDPDLEQVGVLEQTSRKIPILMQRSKSQDGTDIWLFSSQTINRIPFLLSVSREGLLDSFLPDQLKQNHIASVSVGHWMALAVAIGLALTFGYLISWITTWVLANLLKSRAGLDFRSTLFAIKHPLAILLAVSIYRIIINNIGLQVVARDTVGWLAVIATWCAVVWLAWTLFDNIGSRITEGMTRRNRKSSLAVVMLARRAAKAIILAVAAIYIFDLFGLDVTTGLAALGIGGLALALGAQKTIENLVGSLTLIADRPVRVGDFCRFEGTMGTIVDIGIRSTRVRTLEGTYVTIPNGAFASMQIENYAFREEFLFNTTLTLRYETTNEQIKSVLEKLRAYLLEEPKVKRNPFRVRFVELGAHSLDIEIFCYVEANDYATFLEIKEQLLLGVVEIIREEGADFAFPSQTIYLGKDSI